jgi:hypothetical protein
MRNLTDGQYIFANEILALMRTLPAGYFVRSGCAPSHGGGFDVDVAVGDTEVAGAVGAFAGDTATLDSEAVLDLRFDTISISTAAALVVTKGTTDSIAPAPPANHVLVAIVGVVKDALAIVAADIFDCRIIHSYPSIITEGSVTVEQVAGTGYGRIQFEASGPYIVAWRTASAQNGPIVTMSTFTQATGTQWQNVQWTRTDATAIDIIVDYRVIAV